MNNVLKNMLVAGAILVSASAMASELGLSGPWSPALPGTASNDSAIANTLCDCASEMAARTNQSMDSAAVISSCQRIVANGSYGGGVTSSQQHLVPVRQ